MVTFGHGRIGILARWIRRDETGQTGRRQRQMLTIAPLNLRQKPSARAKVTSVVPPNTVITDLGASSNGYHKVAFLGAVGWMYESYLTVS
jgi:uncharacterized protein YgiM (DUF1202 family)